MYIESGSGADYSSLLPSVISALADTVNCIQIISSDIRHHLAAPLVSLVEVIVTMVTMVTTHNSGTLSRG